MKRIFVAIFSLALAAVSARGQLTLSLEQCRELARENDPYMKNATLDVLAAQAQRREARAEYFPTVSATALAFHSLYPFIDLGVTDILGKSDAAWNISNYVDDFTYSNGMSPRYKALQYGYGASVTLMQPIYAGGRIANGNRLAELGVQAAGLKGSLQDRQTGDQVEEKFWLVVSLCEKDKLIGSAMNLLDSLGKDVDSALAAGLVTESDRLQVKLKKSELKSARLQLRNGVRLAKMDLFNAIGVKYSAISSCASEDSPYIDDITLESGLDGLSAPDAYWVSEDELASSMEETKLLDIQVEAKKLEKKMVLGSVLPQLALGGMYGYGHYVGDGKANGAVFAMLSIPLSDWGKTSMKLKRYDYEVRKAENERDYLDSQLILRARQLWLGLTTSWEQMAVASEAVELAKDTYAKQSAAYEAGMVTMSELLQTQTEVINCEESYIESCIGYRKALDSYLALSE